MIIYGWREKMIAQSSIKNHTCSHCGTKNSLFAQVNSMYVHIFWIPVIPLGKKVYSVCSHCKESLSKTEMPPDLQNKAYQIKKEAKTPLWYYAGLTLFAVTIVSLSLFN